MTCPPNEISGITVRLDRLYDALETGKVTLEDLAPRIKQLRLQQEQLNSRKYVLEVMLSDRKVELADLGIIKSHVDDLRSLLDEGTMIERKSFVQSFIKEINIMYDEVVIN